MRTLFAGLWLALTLSLLAASPARADLPPGISGAWYNPAQSGHGLTVELLPGARALVFWHVFDPAGDPVHLYIDGHVIGHSIRGRAYAGRGMRFGSFDPREHALADWGELTLRFDDCGRAGLAWTADGPAGAGYPDGSMPLRRLSAIEDLDCSLPPAGGLPAGRYTGSARLFAEVERPVEGVVDLDGRLWALVADPGWTPLDGIAAQFSSLYLGEPSAPGSRSLDALRVFPSAHRGVAGDVPATPFRLDFTQSGGTWSAEAGIESGRSVALSHREGIDPLRRSFDAAELTGAPFAFTYRTQFFDVPGSIVFHADGTLCVGDEATECSFRGRFLTEDPGLAMVSFELVDQERGFGRFLYSGKAWLLPATAGQPERLFMAGRGTGIQGRGDAGFVLVGTRGR